MTIFKELLNLKIKNGNEPMPYSESGSMLYVHFSPLIDLWIEYIYSTEKRIISHIAVRESFKKIPGYVSHRYCKRIDGKVYRCVVFYKKKAPKEFLELIQTKKGEL